MVGSHMLYSGRLREVLVVLQYRPLIKGKESVREAKPLLRRPPPSPYFEVVREGSLRGAKPQEIRRKRRYESN
jgi:hypothetical protein